MKYGTFLPKKNGGILKMNKKQDLESRLKKRTYACKLLQVR